MGVATSAPTAYKGWSFVTEAEIKIVKQNKNPSSQTSSHLIFKNGEGSSGETWGWEMLGWMCIADFWNSEYSGLWETIFR